MTSMVGIGDLLGAEFLAAAGDTMTAFVSADHLAGYAGLAPAPRDSGKRTGNLHRPRRYNRQLQRVFYTSAQISIQHSPASKAFYDRNEPKENVTAKPYLHSPAAASTCSGPSCATRSPTKNR
jgi:transposase